MAVQLPLQFEFTGDKSFADFYAGGNQEVIDHLKNSLTESGENFVLLWGSRGQGKSHLLQACCHWASEQGKTPFYLPLDCNNLPDHGILEGIDEMDLVSVDNIHCIAGNEVWETAFFNFYNRLRDRGHRLILSSDKPPRELAIKLPDLKTRLAWGLTLRLQPLNEEQQIAALTFRADKMGLEIPPKVGRFLMTHFSRDLPELWRLLERLDRATLSAKRKLTIPFIKQELGL